MKNFFVIFLVLILASCINREARIKKNLEAAWIDYFEEDFASTKPVDVLVVSNRKVSKEIFACEDSYFGVDFSSEVSYGVCKVSVPKNHVVGEIEFAKNNQKSEQNFFKILSGNSLKTEDFIAEVKKSKRTPLIFVHGFNVKFQEAVLRASQISYDLKYQGPIVLFTWPAGAKSGFLEEKMLNKIYLDNKQNANASVTIFKNFIAELKKNNVKFNLTIHSMGHQVALPALKAIAQENSEKILINNLVLNAPDFEANEFYKFAHDLKKISNQITVYCSENDKAIMASKSFNNNNRLGSCAFIDGIDVINVGAIDDAALSLGHGYYSSREILTDISQMFFGIKASKRLFISNSDSNRLEKFILRK